jgi:2-keto-4-pentenoate hydratase/2-oxohepta-3-ene-1,7-dioic acid hydratase in catechol pathway
VLREAASRLDAEEGEEVRATDLGPPLADPDKIVCLGLNYQDHAAEVRRSVSQTPDLFAKFRNALIGPFAPILLPPVSNAIDYEGELAVVIGRRCKSVAQRGALEYVAGFMVMNDVSARDLQRRTSQWLAGKSLDGFAPTGPGIVPVALVGDPQRLMITTRLNGNVVQRASTAEMISSVEDAISFISSVMTLEPGDIIATGTPGGVGSAQVPPRYLQPGDRVEVDIEGVGTISNPVLAAEDTSAIELTTSTEVVHMEVERA